MFNKNNEISFKMQLHLFYGNKVYLVYLNAVF